MTTSDRILSTSDVAIKEVAIEIKVLKIGNKQMTLAVFRQLISERIIDPYTGKLLGIPWGRVNYHTNNCEMLGEHLDIIWQKGNELRRASEPVPWKLGITNYPNKGYKSCVDIVKTWAYQYVITRILENKQAPYDLSPSILEMRDDQELRLKSKIEVDLYLEEYDERISVQLVSEDLYALNTDWGKERLEKKRRSKRDSESTYQYLCERYESQEEYLRELVNSYDQLKATDQLFIAV